MPKRKPRRVGRGAEAANSDSDTSLAPQITVVNPVHNGLAEPARITYRRCPDFIINHYAARGGRGRLAAALVQNPNESLLISDYTDEPHGEICHWLIGRLKLDIEQSGDLVRWTGEPLSVAVTDSLVAIEAQKAEAVRGLRAAKRALRKAGADVGPALERKKVAEDESRQAHLAYNEALKKKAESWKECSRARAVVRSLKLLQEDSIAESAISTATESDSQRSQGAAAAAGSTVGIAFEQPKQQQIGASLSSGQERTKPSPGHIRNPVDETIKFVLGTITAALEQARQTLNNNGFGDALPSSE